MKLSEYRKDYQFFSGKLSDITRQLAFAGIALIWVFKIDGTLPRVPNDLLLPTALLALGLALDLLQYGVQTVIWGLFHRFHEKRRRSGDSDPDVEASPCYNWLALLLFWSKVITVSIALFLVTQYAWLAWRTTGSP